MPIKAGSQRRPDILGYCEQYIKDLAHLYEKTDPALGEPSEQGKLEAARQAISIWWYLWGELCFGRKVTWRATRCLSRILSFGSA